MIPALSCHTPVPPNNTPLRVVINPSLITCIVDAPAGRTGCYVFFGPYVQGGGLFVNEPLDTFIHAEPPSIP